MNKLLRGSRTGGMPLRWLPMVVALSLLVALAVGTPQTLSADRHAIDNDVAADGTWPGQVAAEGAQNWTFTLAEARLQTIRVGDILPAGSGLNVSLDGQDLGTVTGEGILAFDLAAGAHTVTFANLPGQGTVQYTLYMGNVTISIQTSPLNVPAGGGTVTFQINMRNTQVLFDACASVTGLKTGTTSAFFNHIILAPLVIVLTSSPIPNMCT